MRRPTAVALAAATLMITTGLTTTLEAPAQARVPNPNTIGISGFSHILNYPGQSFLVSQGDSGPITVITSRRSVGARIGSTLGTTDMEPSGSGKLFWLARSTQGEIDSLSPSDEDSAPEVYDTGSACPTAVAPTDVEGIWFVDHCPGEAAHLDALDPSIGTVTEVADLDAGTALATDHQHTLYLSEPTSAGSYVVKALEVSGPSSPTATQTLVSPTLSSPALSGPTPRQLVISEDGSTVATSTGAILDTADLSLRTQLPAPTHDTAVAMSSDGLVALASAGSRVNAYLSGDGETYNSYDLGAAHVLPSGLAFDRKRHLAIMEKSGSSYQIHVVEVHAFTGVHVHVDRRRVAYNDRVHVTATTKGLPDGTKVTVFFNGDHRGNDVTQGIVQSDRVAAWLTPRLHGSGTVTVQFDGNKELSAAEGSASVTVVKHLTQRPRHPIGRVHGVYHLRAGHDAVFVTHYRKPFKGACLTYQTSILIRGQWVPYARIKGCLPIPASGIDRIRLPAGLAIPGRYMRGQVEVFATHHAYATDNWPMLRPHDVRFTFVR